MIKFDNEVFTMIWTAGFNAGIKASDKVYAGLINSEQELQKQADEFITQDAKELRELILLKISMEN